jgi:hypothetical protein
MGYKLSKSQMMKHIKNQFIATFLVLVLVLSAIVFCMFENDYKITAMVVSVWVSVLLLRSAFPRYFGGKYAPYVINFLMLAALLNVVGFLHQQYLEYKLYQFDINHDLIFSPEEQTPEQQKYEMLVIGGPAYAFVPIVALFTSLISLSSSFLLFFILKFFPWIEKRLTPKSRIP